MSTFKRGPCKTCKWPHHPSEECKEPYSTVVEALCPSCKKPIGSDAEVTYSEGRVWHRECGLSACGSCGQEARAHHPDTWACPPIQVPPFACSDFNALEPDRVQTPEELAEAMQESVRECIAFAERVAVILQEKALQSLTVVGTTPDLKRQILTELQVFGAHYITESWPPERGDDNPEVWAVHILQTYLEEVPS